MKFRIIVAEDEEITLKHLLNSLRREGYEAEGVSDGISALQRFDSTFFDLLITDVKMPNMSGIELLKEVKCKFPETDVILLTGYGTIGSAVDAVKDGAYDYITKPFDLEELLFKIKKIYQEKMLRRENIALKTFLGVNKGTPVIAKSQPMQELLSMVDNIRESECNVLITGETGTGKNLLAKVIHFTSRRKRMPFLTINCANLTEELLSSELFGHEQGAFTGAVRTKQGLVEIADSGTLFLDEIAEMTTALQAKLLKVIEEGEFYRVGGTKPINVDVRFIAATNQDVKKLIEQGRFREDLYYRINIMELEIPPLRQRREDIMPLARYFLSMHQLNKKRISDFSNESVELLENYCFPGNVRELENLVERAVILEKKSLITQSSLPCGMKISSIETPSHDNIKHIDALSREYAEKVIDIFMGNKSRAAEALGISRTSLWRLLSK
ncbi:MAG: sigma-54 dependent transcriptional regulator [Dissulfurispiraceae bacterium]|nr:sigma-54 dependent transcriptional regulator [Dissulfurispiraceae bacterium]